MGETLAPGIAQQTVLAPSVPPSTTSYSLPALLTELPPSLEAVTRPLSLNGTIIGMLSSEDITLRTSLGLITLALGRMADNETLKAIADLLKTPTGRSPNVDLFIETGAPPQKATLSFQMAQRPEAKEASQPSAAGSALSAHTPSAVSTQRPDKHIPTGTPLTIAHILDETAQAHRSPATPVPPAQANTTQGPKADTPDMGVLQTNEIDIPHDLSSKQGAGLQRPVAMSAAPLQTPPFKLVIHTVLPPDTNAAPQAPQDSLAQSGSFLATLASKTQSGQPLLKADGLTLVLDEPLDLPVGSKLLVSVLPDKYGSKPESFPATDATDFVRAYLAALDQTDPQAARFFQDVRLPTPQHNLAGTLLFFLTALQNRKTEEWLTPPFSPSGRSEKDIKTQAKTLLAQALEGDLSSTATDSRKGEWASYPVPLHYQGSLDMIRLYVAKEHDHPTAQEQDHRQSAKKTRFIVSMCMSRLGPIQLDGLANKAALDLVLRSERELPAGLAHSIRESALASFDAIGIKGTILFQSGLGNWIHLQDKINTIGVEV